jgi:hypothetical protein
MFLFTSLSTDAGIERNLIYPSSKFALSAKLLKAFPQIDKYLLKKISHLISIFGKHIANRVDGAAMLIHKICKFVFCMLHV